jgi:putative zinc finger protein
MITKHVSLDGLTGYIYRTLDDGQREVIDAHLVECPTCRASLAKQEIRQRQVSNELSALLKFAAPSPQMNFAAIAPRLQNQPLRQNIWLDRVIFVPTTLALSGFVLALFGLWRAIGDQAFTSPAQSLGATPTLACFFLTLASVEKLYHSFSIRPRGVITWALALTLWLGSAFIGLLDLIVLRDLAIMAVIAMDGLDASAGPIAIMTVLFGAMLYIGFVIGGAEYHYKNIGQPGSWKLFSITLLCQLFILILPYLIW